MYGCDCDGVRREGPLDRGEAEGAALRAVLSTVAKLTGYEPPTCPWRAMSEPIVREVLTVSWSVEAGNLGAILGPDPDSKLTDAIGVYRRSVEVTRAEEMRLEREDRERRAKHTAAARKAGIR